ncbi:hypothetical protein [Helicobacter marmotae]|nr:hypothetical protein [Helicobacter marmotae]
MKEILRYAQNDNKSNPQDKITLQRKLVCHSEALQKPKNLYPNH